MREAAEQLTSKMRIRTIKPEFFLHADLYELEIETKLPVRVAFAGLWCASDRAGRFAWKPRALGVQILPYDCAAGLDFSRVLDACLTRGFVAKYRVGADWFGAIPSWRKHQFINNRESESSLPDISQAEEVAHASTTRAPRVPHATEGEGKGMDGNGMEGEGVKDASSTRRLGAKFTPPSIGDWNTYATSIGFPADQATQAHSHYEANGWKVGRNPMKNWQAACRTCYGRWKEQGQQPAQLPLGAQRVQGATKLSDYAPRPSLGALQIELKAVREEIADILHPGGCTYSVEPKGEKLTRFNELKDRRARMTAQMEGLT